jgi:hypothetical protein
MFEPKATASHLDSTRSATARTHGHFRSWGKTGCAIRLPDTAAFDPSETSSLVGFVAGLYAIRW